MLTLQSKHDMIIRQGIRLLIVKADRGSHRVKPASAGRGDTYFSNSLCLVLYKENDMLIYNHVKYDGVEGYIQEEHTYSPRLNEESVCYKVNLRGLIITDCSYNNLIGFLKSIGAELS